MIPLWGSQTGCTDVSQSAPAVGTGTSPLTQGSLSQGGVTAGRASLLPHCARFCVCCVFVCYVLMSLSLPPLDTIPNNAERSKDYGSSSEIIECFVRHSTYKLFPLLSSQLFGHLPHFPHAVYMVLLENNWVQSNWPFRSCKNPFFIPRPFALFFILILNRFTEPYCWMCRCVFLSAVSLFCPEQKRSCMSGRSAWRRSKKSWRKWRGACLCTLAQQEEVRHPARPATQ